MKRIAQLVTVMLFVTIAHAQQLTLFESVESVPEPARNLREPEQNSVQPGTPAFTLRSSSRFGDEYHSVLTGKNGESIVVTWNTGANVGLTGYSGYSVVNVTSRELTLRLPASDRCIPMEGAGVRCSGDNIAVLSLANKSPLQNNGTTPQPNQAVAVTGDNIVVGVQGQPVFINPFTGVTEEASQESNAELVGREQRARNRAERLSQFEPVRISEQEIPPGMRLVRTPFGDRLVPEREQ